MQALRLSQWLRDGDLQGWLSCRYRWAKIPKSRRGTTRERQHSISINRESHQSRRESHRESQGLSPPFNAISSGDKKTWDYLHSCTEADERWFDDISESLGPLHKAMHGAELLQKQNVSALHDHLLMNRGPALDDILEACEHTLKQCGLTDPGGLVDYISSVAGE